MQTEKHLDTKFLAILRFGMCLMACHTHGIELPPSARKVCRHVDNDDLFSDVDEAEVVGAITDMVQRINAVKGDGFMGRYLKLSKDDLKSLQKRP
jgi:hypothetical protein